MTAAFSSEHSQCERLIVPNFIQKIWSAFESVSDIIERWVSIVHDWTASALLVATTTGSNDLTTFLFLSSGSVLAHGLLLDLELAEKHITLVFLDLSLFIHVIVIVVKITHSPVRGIISFLLLSTTSKLLGPYFSILLELLSSQLMESSLCQMCLPMIGFAFKLLQFVSRQVLCTYFDRLFLDQCCWKKHLGPSINASFEKKRYCCHTSRNSRFVLASDPSHSP